MQAIPNIGVNSGIQFLRLAQFWALKGIPTICLRNIALNAAYYFGWGKMNDVNFNLPPKYCMFA
ncbi:MAG: hypothetical protein FD181_2333 [Prolixibacteraceae bacterium]|nr:MAG: hypothetical protein FD181_2333 [Prolixibacteraceae bacterium]